MRKGYQTKTVMAMAAIGAALSVWGTAPAEAASFLEEVPVSDWSYQAVNGLIDAGKVPGYAAKIPEGRVMSRLEMAAIVESAEGNQAAMTPTEQQELTKLKNAYDYDIKKLELINRLDGAAEHLNQQSRTHDDGFTPEEKAGLKKAAALADKLSISGYGRLRNDHRIKETGGRQTIANKVQVFVASNYQVNEDWQAHADLYYRSSLSSGFDESRRTLWPDDNHTGIIVDPYITGRLLHNSLGIKAGKWNEWNIYGWGMDMDCDFAGFQLDYGKKDFKTFLTVGKMDLWDNVMGGTREDEEITSLRFFYPFDKKNDVNFGVSWSSAMQSRYQDPDQGRVFYYYGHAHHRFDKNWDLRAGLIASNAKRDPSNPVASTKSKHPGRWLQLLYKGEDLQRPGSYGIKLTYRYEPALSWPTVTDWCDLNDKFVRLAFSYVPAKNILLDTFYSWEREIDTGDRDDMYRFQAQFFF